MFPGDGSQVEAFGGQDGAHANAGGGDDELRRVLELSEREISLQREQEEQEDEELQMILKLSLTEK